MEAETEAEERKLKKEDNEKMVRTWDLILKKQHFAKLNK